MPPDFGRVSGTRQVADALENVGESRQGTASERLIFP
jgi:hypothetical protein